MQAYCNRKLVVGASYDCNENDKIDGIDIWSCQDKISKVVLLETPWIFSTMYLGVNESHGHCH